MVLTKQIKDAIIQILTDADLKVNGVPVKIIFGEKTKNENLKPPSIWIYPEPSPIGVIGMTEDWKYNFIVASIVENDDPDLGLDQVEELAWNASEELLKDKTLKGSTRDLMRINFFPGYQRAGNISNRLYGAGYGMQAKIFEDC